MGENADLTITVDTSRVESALKKVLMLDKALRRLPFWFRVKLFFSDISLLEISTEE